MLSQKAEFELKNEQILNEVRRDIKKRQLDGSLPSFQDVLQGNQESEMVRLDVDGDTYEEEKLRRNLTVLKKNYMVVLDRPLVPGLSKKNRFIRKAVRRLTRFYIGPVVRDQNSLNAATANTLHQMSRCIAKQQAQIRELKKEVESLQRSAKH